MWILNTKKISPAALRLVAVAGLAAALGACQGVELDEVQGIEPQGSEFSQHLYEGYVTLSSNELAEYDYRDSNRFARKAAAAAGGDDVMPTAIEERSLPADQQGALAEARASLIAVLDGSGRTKAPADTARAQLMFECWIQEQEEGHQAEDISGCQEGFNMALAAAEEALIPPPPPEPEPVVEPEPEPSYVTYYVVFFDFDSAELSSSAQTTLDEAAATALEMRPYKIIIRGHADRAGPEKYNLGLSESRALAVASYMVTKGAGRFAVIADGVGESEPIARTADGVRDGRNRRTEISLIEAE